MALPPLDDLLALIPENAVGEISATDHQAIVTALYDGIVDTVTSSGGGAVPIGGLLWWPGDTIPDGWEECSGQALNRTTYSDLFAAIGTIYGPGDGATTFNLPDPRGLFVRAQDGGAGKDPDVLTRTDRGDGLTGDNVGTKQDDEFKSHQHDTGFGIGIAADLGGGPLVGNNYNNVYFTNLQGGAETRPTNIYFKLIIRTSTVTDNTFTTGEQLVAAGTTAAIAHLMSGAPSRFQAFVRCKVAEFGYNIGDEVPIASADQGAVASTGVAMFGDGTNLNFRVAAGGVAIVSFTDGTSQVVADPNWALFIRIAV